MEKHHHSFIDNVPPEDWENTPDTIKNLVGSLMASTALSEDESRLIQVLDATPIGIAVHDATGKLIYINNIGRSLLGTNRTVELETDRLSASFQVYRTTSQAPYPIDDLPSTIALTGKFAKTDDLEIRHPDRIIYLEVSATPIFDDQGQVIYAIATFQDISERKSIEAERKSNEAERRRAEIALQESEQRLRNLTNAVPGAVYQFRLSHDGVSSIVFMSQGIQQLVGISPDWAMSDIQNIWGLILPEDLEHLFESIAISAQTLEPWNIEFRIQTASGQIKWILGQSIPSQQSDQSIIWNGILTDISDRKQAELSLEKTEQRFRQLFESTPKIAVQGYNLQRQVIYWNDASTKLYGYTKAEVLGQKLEDLIIPEPMRQDVIAGIQNWIDNGEVIPADELILRHKDGSDVAVYSSHIMLSNIEGEREIYCVDIDLRERKQAEMELRRVNETNQALIDAIPDLIIRVNRDGFYLGSIGSDEIEFAIPLEQLIGKRVADVLEPQLAQMRMSLVERAFATGEVQFHEYRIDIRGNWRYEEARIVVSGENEAIILIRDITARKTAELALQESEARYRLLSENTNDLVCLHDPDGHYIYVSPSCESLLGYSYDEMIGRDPYDFFHPDDCDRLRQEAHVNALQGKSVPTTYRIRQKSGNYIWFETLTKPIMDKNGMPMQLQTTSRDVTERIQAQAKLAYDSLHDALTGLPNRNLLSERLELAIHRIHRHNDYKFAVLFLDLDRFKIVNDSLGHVVGDRLLIAIAQKLRATFRGIDLITRIGGDEFVVLLEDIQDIQEAVHATERLLNSFQSPVAIGDRQVYTSCSVGIVLGSPDYHQSSELLRDADIAMYRAKNQGKARYEIFDIEMHRQAMIRMHLENDLRQAIELQEFSLHYQPLVCLENSELIGFEALIRWHHRTQGWKSPNEFIPVAEELGIIHQLSHWVLNEACHQLAAWHRAFPKFANLKVNVNLSSQDLHHPNLLAQLDQVLAETQLPPHLLTIEITERMVIENVEETIATLAKLRERSIEISIDDFGTGYSSLSYLHLLPVNSLKVDRSFVNQMTDSNKNYRIVETIATLSHQLGFKAIAEGIETIAQLNQLKELKYEHGQGFLFAKSLDAATVEKLLEEQEYSLHAIKIDITNQN